MTQFLFANNAISNLASPLSSSTTTITVTTGTGALFPSPSTGQQFALTLNDVLTGNVYEIVYVTARTGDSMTVVRGQEGTTPTTWVLGDNVGNFWTAGTGSALETAALSGIIRNGNSAYAVSTTLTSVNFGQIVFYTGSAAATFTLPAANATTAYAGPIVISNQSVFALTVAAQSGNATDLQQPILQQGQTMCVTNDGTTTWHGVWNDAGGTTPFTVGLPTATTHATRLGQFGGTFGSQTGSLQSPSPGAPNAYVYEMWGTVNVAANTVITVTLPTLAGAGSPGFPNDFDNLVISEVFNPAAPPAANTIGQNIVNNSQFQLGTIIATTIMWRAWGR